MRFTKRTLMKTAAAGSVFVGALAVAAPASANSFGPTDYGTGGFAMVSYDDPQDDFCVHATEIGGAILTVAPYDSNRGPTFTELVPYGQTRCVGLQTAWEDSNYYYQITIDSFIYGNWYIGAKVPFRS